MDQVVNKKKILVTGVGGPAGINAVKLLRQKENVEIIGCDIDDTAAGQSFVDKFLISPKVADTEQYEQWIRDTIKDENIDLLIPTVDEELLPLSRFISETGVFVSLSPTETLKVSADKLASYNFVSDHLPQYCVQFVPLSEWTENWSDQKTFFIKPCQGRGGRGCKVVSREELVWIKANSSNLNDLIVMEELPGTEWTVDIYIAKNGELVYLVPRERLALSGGISIKGRTVKNEQVINATKLLLKELPFRGPVCIQWKADAEGNPKFVEINPRLSGGLMISVGGGIGPIDALLSELNNETPAYQDWREVTVVGHMDYQIINT